ncbi:MAG: hypothetical protein LPK03_11840, partial [Pontibacter sp.]|nr:hypothetical protein [Pontibacter sp.]
MQTQSPHSFHIPVMGLAFSIDTPIKVARYGISSALSLSDDTLLEQMRGYYSLQYGFPFTPITKNASDYRAQRVTAYLNLVKRIVEQQLQEMRRQDFTPGNELSRYFEMLPDRAPLKQQYLNMLQTEQGAVKACLQEQLRHSLTAGSIDVNIMTKLDRTNYSQDGKELPQEFTDALSALRGF